MNAKVMLVTGASRGIGAAMARRPGRWRRLRRLEGSDRFVHAGAGQESAKSVVPLGRAGLADEVAQAALWLASDAASYVHGTVIDVAGGR